MAAIAFEEVSKRFGTVTVLDRLDLRIEEGEFFTFVGPSGCGKSTTLTLIAGLERPSAGTIRFDGQPVNHLAPRDRDVAMVFQSYALYPHMSVAENIGFPLKLRGTSGRDIETAVAEVAARLGIEALLARRPRELSGGQRQRVALGRALVRRPRVFLLDEPLSNLDARLRLEMRAELKRLHGEYGITTVYVTHDQEEAMALSDRVAVLNAGRIEQCGPPLDVYRDPANLFVAGFVGSPPINVLDARHFRGLAPPADVPASGVVVGLRPADVRVATEARPLALAGDVQLAEPTGDALWVVGRIDGQQIIGRGQLTDAPVPGTTAYFEYEPERLYLFERATGRRVP
ncbi:MAG: ABC transporter ATP-binding protein [Gammaproteobacteria bacterium]|nr:ABC transporter ATP-binding protein [Gammaproteobacteria bacterium]